MIEINLVPDVKQELLKAQRIRSSVISLAVFIAIIAVGIVVVLALYVFAIQAGRNYFVDQTVSAENKKLSSVEDVSNVLTLQNQLTKLSEMHTSKHITSRVFEVLNTITPQDANKVATTNLSVDTATNTVKIEAQADSGYAALDVFKKTIEATKLTFTKDGATQTMPLSNSISLGDQSYGEDASGKKVLRFTLSFEYPPELFARDSLDASIVAPTRTNATDSYLGVPTSLFTVRAQDLSEGN